MTPYSKIYIRFLNKIEDYDLPSIPEEDLEDMMLEWLNTAIVNFTRSKSDLSDRDDENKMFNDDLTMYEIEVLALYMVVAWLDQRINSVKLTNQFLGGAEEKLWQYCQQFAA